MTRVLFWLSTRDTIGWSGSGNAHTRSLRLLNPHAHSNKSSMSATDLCSILNFPVPGTAFIDPSNEIQLSANQFKTLSSKRNLYNLTSWLAIAMQRDNSAQTESNG